MSTTTYPNNPCARPIKRRNSQTSTAKPMTNDRSQFPLRTNHFLTPIPPIRASLSTDTPNSNSSLPPRNQSTTNTKSSLKSVQQIYTFSNPPCELPRKRASSASQRVSSAPDENSPRSRLNQPKSSSATVSTPRSYDDSHTPSVQTSKHHEQQKDSLNALLRKQEKSKVPKSVQQRRIVLFFPRTTPEQEQKASSISTHNQTSPDEKHPLLQTNNQTKNSNSQSIDFSDSMEAEMADSMQLAAILAQMQLSDGFNSNESLAKQNPTLLDPSKYEYIVANPSDMATYKLSPRTLKPAEELAARLRFSQYYQSEMRSSANAQIPPLMASIATENTATMGTNSDAEQIFTFKLNSTDTIQKENPLFEVPIENEFLHLCYDSTLKRFYDPNTGKYYELTSE